MYLTIVEQRPIKSHSPISGDFGHGRRLEAVLPVRRFTRRAEMGSGPIVSRGKFFAINRSGSCFLAHPGNGRPRPESTHGGQDELPGLCKEHRRLRNRTQRSKGNTFSSHTRGPFDGPAEYVESHRWRLVLLAVTSIRFSIICVYQYITSSELNLLNYYNILDNSL